MASHSAKMRTEILDEAHSILNKCKALSQRVATFTNRLVGESDALAVEVRGLQQACSAAEAAARKHPEPQLAADVLSELRAAKDVLNGLGPGGDLRKFCKPKAPVLLRLLLGNKVDVVAYRADQSMAMKEEYHRFRDRASLIMLLGPAALVLGMRHADNMRAADGTATAGSGSGSGWPEVHPALRHTFTPGLMTGAQLYFLYLGYFYLASALRENVLLVNGSHIKAWWIQHHYWASGASLLLLGLPVYSPAVYLFVRWFLVWSCFQALVMMFQNRYQRRRMYTRIAVGKSSAMDVVSGESSGTSGQLLVLYPLLFALQGAQFAIGAGVVARTWPALWAREGWLEEEAPGSDLRGMRGVFLVGTVFCYMALQNFRATISTLLDKKAFASKAKRAAGRARDGPGAGISASKPSAAAN